MVGDMNIQTTPHVEDQPKLTVLKQLFITPEMADELDEIERVYGTKWSAFARLAITDRLERFKAMPKP